MSFIDGPFGVTGRVTWPVCMRPLKHTCGLWPLDVSVAFAERQKTEFLKKDMVLRGNMLAIE